ncbi:MAG: site-specific DNA-methyltransferase [Candidatus Poribacteria bacterium]|nr:site-specific DNA-methyltransferase [Candidatus Poribacteria bacterium]
MTDSVLPRDQILCGDNLELIRRLPDGCVQLVITSPPYFQQRDYGAGMGNEKHLDDYLDNLLRLFCECVRVVTPDGSLVFNLGDKYENSSLLLVPYRFAIAATETGLVNLVNSVTWVKKNPTPRQFRRRLVNSSEPFFHFVKSDAYFYNLDAFMVSDNAPKKPRTKSTNVGKRYFELIDQSDLPEEAKRNARLALEQVIQEVHRGQIAGFRMKIRGLHAEPFGGQDGGRQIQLEKNGFTIIRIHGNTLKRDVIETPVESIKGLKHPAIYPVKIVEEFLHLLTRPSDVVLDPFIGSGSTAVACKKLGRRVIGYDINPEYCESARKRVAETPSETLTLFGNTP